MRDGWIDAHHHLWHYSPQEFGWISNSMQALKQDFLPGDLEQVGAAYHVTGTVAVQARQTLEETDWLLGLVRESPLIRGVVGWVPLIDAGVERVLERLAANPAFVGVRHVLHDEPDAHYMLRDDFNRGIRSLGSFDLCYDLLLFPRHLPQTIELVDRHPNQSFVLDHIAKPAIASGEISSWASNLRQLAERGNVSCKLSGMVTEADWSRWTPADLQPYFDLVLEAFGPSRLMFGSDWPVLNLASDYGRWQRTVAAMLRPLSPDEAQAIMQGTAERVYALSAEATATAS